MSKTIERLKNLHGRRAVITGATGHLGIVIAETLAELGADLILVDRPKAEYCELKASLIERFSVNVDCVDCDLENKYNRESLLEYIKNKYSEISILINNAAFTGDEHLTGWAVPFSDQTVITWSRAIEVNLTAVFELCQGLTRIMSNSEGSTIINIASIYGIYGPDWRLYEKTDMGNPAAYAASKGGLIQFTKWLATTVAPKIRVNTISPGGIYRCQSEKFHEKYKNKTPLRRMANEDDFRGVIAFLASDLSGYITGQNIIVDGGFGVW